MSITLKKGCLVTFLLFLAFLVFIIRDHFGILYNYKTVSVAVYDARDGTPIPGAIVHAQYPFIAFTIPYPIGFKEVTDGNGMAYIRIADHWQEAFLFAELPESLAGPRPRTGRVVLDDSVLQSPDHVVPEVRFGLSGSTDGAVVQVSLPRLPEAGQRK